MDRFDAIEQIKRIAREHELAVSVISVSDVASSKGADEDDEGGVRPEVRDAVVSSWEWRHYGDNWADWFDGVELPG